MQRSQFRGGGDAPKVSGPYVGYSRRQSHRLCRLCQLSLQFILMIGSWVWQTLEVDFCRYWSASESSRLTCIPSCVATISTSEILSEMTVCELGKSETAPASTNGARRAFSPSTLHNLPHPPAGVRTASRSLADPRETAQATAHETASRACSARDARLYALRPKDTATAQSTSTPRRASIQAVPG